MHAPIARDGGWVVDIRYWGRRTQLRFYVGLRDPDAAAIVVEHALKIGRGYTVHVLRRLTKAHAILLKLKHGELRAT